MAETHDPDAHMACSLQKLNLCLTRGATIDLPLRFESPDWRYIAISAVTNTAPITLTATAHGIPHGWRGVLTNIVGPAELNTARAIDKLRDQDYHRLSVIDANTIGINKINAAAMPAYVSGGQIVIRSPLDMSQYVDARMQINDAPGQLAYFDVANGGLVIDTINQALRIQLTAAQSSALTWSSGLYDIELITGSGRVDKPVSPESQITVSAEQTTDHV